jgi:hypothetical protein
VLPIKCKALRSKSSTTKKKKKRKKIKELNFSMFKKEVTNKRKGKNEINLVIMDWNPKHQHNLTFENMGV